MNLNKPHFTARQVVLPTCMIAVIIIIYAIVWTHVSNQQIAVIEITDEESGETTVIEDGFNAELMTDNYSFIASALTGATDEPADGSEGDPYCTISLLNRKDKTLYTITYTDEGIYVNDGHDFYTAEGENLETLPAVFLKLGAAAKINTEDIRSAVLRLPNGQKKTFSKGITFRLCEALGDASGLGEEGRPDFEKNGIYSITCSDDAGMENYRILVYEDETWFADLKENTYQELGNLEDFLGWIEDFYDIER